MSICYLSLGSNMGDRERNIREAVALINDHERIDVRKVSSIYLTAPLGYTEQADFLNIALQAETTLFPQDLLEVCMSVEEQLQRVRTIHWGPRTIDIDILLFDDIYINNPVLSIPHPMMMQRLFVLFPLAEINANLRWQGKSVKEYMDQIQDQQVCVYKPW